jgi:endogenous inhibitor of DNA gyrase (YacG/DUF329 family)
VVGRAWHVARRLLGRALRPPPKNSRSARRGVSNPESPADTNCRLSLGSSMIATTGAPARERPIKLTFVCAPKNCVGESVASPCLKTIDRRIAEWLAPRSRPLCSLRTHSFDLGAWHDDDVRQIWRSLARRAPHSQLDLAPTRAMSVGVNHSPRPGPFGSPRRKRQHDRL